MDKSTINGNLPINGVLMGIYDGDSMAFNGI